MRLLLVVALAALARGLHVDPCESQVYCKGRLLDTVQMARLYNDSKTFVDMSMRADERVVVKRFDQLMAQTGGKPTKRQLAAFVGDNFESGGDLEPWKPPDYNPNPKLLGRIPYAGVREFASRIVSLWPVLGRKVKESVLDHPKRHSLIPVPEGFIVAGGRFQEYYYWDTYWIVKGLLLSEMTQTVRGILDNFVSLVKRFGMVPNGGRVYYLNRSQPPLLTMMVEAYMKATGDKTWLRANVKYLELELRYWLDNQIVEVKKNGRAYKLARYDVNSRTPRPESYAEDVSTAAFYPSAGDRESTYKELKSGAESGWDFTSRWIFDKAGGNHANLSHIRTTRVVPVDLNSFLCRSFADLKSFHATLGNARDSKVWGALEETWRRNIHEFLWDEADGVWYDYDLELKSHRRYFYPSNVAPLWTGSHDPSKGAALGASVLKYLNRTGILRYQGGVPTSLQQTGEQWDFPNAWPPLQAIVVQALERSGDAKAQATAETMARLWVRANILGYLRTQEMFEKYDAVVPGDYGGGGEYEVQTGFGWTNGVALEFIDAYLTR